MTDQELIELLDQRGVDQWPAEQLVLLRQRVRQNAAVREAFLARVRLEEALQGALARPPYTVAALSAGVAALLLRGASAGLARAAIWWWGTLGTTALVATVAVGTWALRDLGRDQSPPPPLLVQRLEPLPLVAPEPSDPGQAEPLANAQWSPSDELPQGFARHWDPQATPDSSPSSWSAPMGALPLVAPGPDGTGP